MVEQGQRWATPDSTIRIQKDLINDPAIEVEDRGHLKRMKRRGRRIKALVLFSLIGVVTLIGLATAFDHYFIPSPAMEPTIGVGDRIIANQLSYRFGDVDRGDVVIFESTAVDSTSGFDAVKRVIALPGESIEIIGGVVYIDGAELDEPYLDEVFVEEMPATPVPSGHYFLMGDNREESADSRNFGAVPEGKIKARAMRTYWPLDRQTSL